MNISTRLVTTAAILLMAGCSWSIGDRDRVEYQPSLGEELLDLKTALDEEAITEQEYNRAKRELLTSSRKTKASPH